MTTGEPVEIFVALETDTDEEDIDEHEFEQQVGEISAPLYLKEKSEEWWIVIDTIINTRHFSKHVSLHRTHQNQTRVYGNQQS